MTDGEVYGLVGDDGIRKLVAGFYRRVAGDDLLGVMYPREDLAGAENRLGGFLIQRFGGPDAYSRERGHPRLRMRHAPFKVDQAARDRWMKLMIQAMDECDLPLPVRELLEKYFHETATFMINHAGQA